MNERRDLSVLCLVLRALVHPLSWRHDSLRRRPAVDASVERRFFALDVALTLEHNVRRLCSIVSA
jgi:hypothetical protein